MGKKDHGMFGPYRIYRRTETSQCSINLNINSVLQKPSNNAYIQLKVDEYADLKLDLCTTWISPHAILIKYDM